MPELSVRRSEPSERRCDADAVFAALALNEGKSDEAPSDAVAVALAVPRGEEIGTSELPEPVGAVADEPPPDGTVDDDPPPPPPHPVSSDAMTARTTILFTFGALYDGSGMGEELTPPEPPVGEAIGMGELCTPPLEPDGDAMGTGEGVGAFRMSTVPVVTAGNRSP